MMGGLQNKGRRPTIFITALRLVCTTACNYGLEESTTPLFIACVANEQIKSSTGEGMGIYIQL